MWSAEGGGGGCQSNGMWRELGDEDRRCLRNEEKWQMRICVVKVTCK